MDQADLLAKAVVIREGADTCSFNYISVRSPHFPGLEEILNPEQSFTFIIYLLSQPKETKNILTTTTTTRGNISVKFILEMNSNDLFHC